MCLYYVVDVVFGREIAGNDIFVVDIRAVAGEFEGDGGAMDMPDEGTSGTLLETGILG